MAAVTGSGVWTNSDGLRVRFGTNKSLDAKEGSPKQAGEHKIFEFEIDATDLPAHTDTQERFLNRVPSVALPAGYLLVSASLVTITGFTGSGATLTLGLAQQDGTTIDADGIDAAIALTAIDAVGETVTCDGALIGTKLAADGFMTVTVGTATHTAGKARLIVKMLAPA